MQGTVHGFGRRVTPRLRPWKTVGGAESVYLVIVLLYIKTCFGDITVDWTGVRPWLHVSWGRLAVALLPGESASREATISFVLTLWSRAYYSEMYASSFFS